MLRKFVIATAAVAALGTASLAPTSASATYLHGYVNFLPHFYAQPICFYKWRWVWTYWGKRKLWYRVCNGY